MSRDGCTGLNVQARRLGRKPHHWRRRHLPEQMIQHVTTMVAILTTRQRVMLIAVGCSRLTARGPLISGDKIGDRMRVEGDGQRAREKGDEQKCRHETAQARHGARTIPRSIAEAQPLARNENVT